jgi:hypothetical protein
VSYDDCCQAAFDTIALVVQIALREEDLTMVSKQSQNMESRKEGP